MLVRSHFPYRRIGLESAAECAPLLTNVSPLDLFFWDFLEGGIYANNSRTDREREVAAVSELGSVPSQIVDDAIEDPGTIRLSDA